MTSCKRNIWQDILRLVGNCYVRNPTLPSFLWKKSWHKAISPYCELSSSDSHCGWLSKQAKLHDNLHLISYIERWMGPCFLWTPSWLGSINGCGTVSSSWIYGTATNWFPLAACKQWFDLRRIELSSTRFDDSQLIRSLNGQGSKYIICHGTLPRTLEVAQQSTQHGLLSLKKT